MLNYFDDKVNKFVDGLLGEFDPQRKFKWSRRLLLYSVMLFGALAESFLFLVLTTLALYYHWTHPFYLGLIMTVALTAVFMLPLHLMINRHEERPKIRKWLMGDGKWWMFI